MSKCLVADYLESVIHKMPKYTIWLTNKHSNWSFYLCYCDWLGTYLCKLFFISELLHIICTDTFVLSEQLQIVKERENLRIVYKRIDA